MKTFEESGLSPDLLRAIAEMGFEKPTPVQEKVIPRLLEGGRDLVALAQTGTGKTAAYGLPLLHRIDTSRPVTQGLILCPTRELCLQIAGDLADFTRYRPEIRVLAVYGGSSIDAQIRALHRGVHVIVATPGRINDLLRRRAAKLMHVERVVLDEADEMLNMGFQEDLETILQEVPDEAQTLLFSATMPPEVATIASRYMHEPEEVVVGTRNAVADHVRHECYAVTARDRYRALKRILDAHPGLYGIVFCRTRMESQDVAERLLHDGYSADALHGDLTQAQRDRAMNLFRARAVRVLVATDVAARGLDVDDLTHVIHYSLPDDVEPYTHRSGRTGRAGKGGVSAAFVPSFNDRRLRAIEQAIHRKFQHKAVPTGPEVCEAQLLSLLEKVRQIHPDPAALAPYQPALDDLLREIPAEEVVRRFILRDLDRFLEYYRDAADLHTPAERAPAAAPAPAERGSRPGRAERIGQPSERRSMGALTRCRINLGHMNALTPSSLLSFINRAAGRDVRVGRIDVTLQTTTFDVAQSDAEFLVQTLNGAVYDDRTVRLVAVASTRPPTAHGAGHGHGRGAPGARPAHGRHDPWPGRFHRPGPGKKPPGHKHKRGPGDSAG